MKYIIPGTILTMAALLASTGVALAKEGSDDGLQASGSGGVGISQTIQAGLGSLFGRHDQDDDNGTDVTVGAGATSTHDVGDDKGGDKGWSASSNRSRENEAGDDKGGLRGATSSDDRDNEHATSSKDRGIGFGRGGVAGFLQWFFGLPASTTVGDIRAEIQASSTASTTAGSSENSPQGLGFIARFFGWFGGFFGGRGDN